MTTTTKATTDFAAAGANPDGAGASYAPASTPAPTDGDERVAAAPPWHALAAGEALARLASSERGLSAAEAARRLGIDGPNALPRAETNGTLQVLARQFRDPLVWVLLGSATLAMLLGKVADGMVVLAIVVINTVIGFVHEHRAGRAVEALLRMVPEFALARRDGATAPVPAAELVAGDVVLLGAGDKVPADLRLVSGKGLRVDEAALTGESVPVDKSSAPVERDAALGDRRNMLFKGTLASAGTGVGVVVATGPRTELGRISELLEAAVDLETPLTRSMRQVGAWITVAIAGVAAVLLAAGTLRGAANGVAVFDAFRDSMLFAIALAVGAIPEGLPAIVTIALAIGVQRMASRRAIVRRLPAVETLGSTTVICSDKTGTLTRNEMTVTALWTPAGDAAELTGVGYRPDGELRGNGDEGALRELLAAAALCNDAELRELDAAWSIVGDPTEGALVVAAHKAGVAVDALRRDRSRLDVVPFSSESKLMATLHAWPDGGPRLVIKGAPEEIAGRCRLADDALDRVVAEVERMAAGGLRTLAVADKRLSPGADGIGDGEITAGFALLGVVGMIDPPRPEAIAAVAACHAAGIRVKMITGDHPGTARAVARELGLADGVALTGVGLANLDDAALEDAVGRTDVFARVAPEHKLRLVRALQAQGDVVAMTGDGVNDAPALKQANIGVAMGVTGTSVSKEAADLVLTDDNFATITSAVEEGRRVWDNLVKSLAFVLPTNIGLALILICAVAFFPFLATGEIMMPIQPTQLLWINMVGAVALALPLAFEARELDVMRRPPRDPSTPVLSRFVVVRTAVAAVMMTAGAVALFLWEHERSLAVGHAEELALARAQTMAVTTVVLFQVFYLMNCRSLRHSMRSIGWASNPAVFVGIGVLLALQAAFIFAPPLQRVFETTALEPRDLALSAAVGATILPVITIEKRVREHRNRPRPPRSAGTDARTQ
jgi:Ca2+-transporting ATPase